MRSRSGCLALALFLSCLVGCASSLPSRTHVSERFTLHTDSPAEETEAIRIKAEEFLTDLEEYLGLEAPPVGLLRIVHFRWRLQLWSYLGREVPAFRWRKGACFETPQAYTLALSGRPAQDRFQQVLRHELSHFFVASRFSEFPPWIDEGLAQVLSEGPPFPRPGGDGPGFPEAGRERPPDRDCFELLSMGPGRKLSWHQYGLAGRLTRFLLTCSEDAIPRLLRFLEISEHGRDAREVFLDAWGIGFEDACSALTGSKTICYQERALPEPVEQQATQTRRAATPRLLLAAISMEFILSGIQEYFHRG